MELGVNVYSRYRLEISETNCNLMFKINSLEYLYLYYRVLSPQQKYQGIFVTQVIMYIVHEPVLLNLSFHYPSLILCKELKLLIDLFRLFLI